jgi:isoleucyl-tRNA synthetase
MNAYKFMIAQVILVKTEYNQQFTFNPKADVSENIMDRWILASCQSLIKFVKEEMAAYRLYTVVPRLLKMIDDLTNWYIRFNRRRLKAENGVEDALVALNTLFDVLLVLARTMAPFTPFLTESMYQGLRQFFPPGYVLEKDMRSVHFLPLPEVREAYFDANIERAVGRMQTVIVLGRTLRDKKDLPLKTPLKELVIIHRDPTYQSDLIALDGYIRDELNVRTALVSGDEDKYGVEYKATPDNKAIGERFRADAGKVRGALTSLSTADVRTFMTNKTVTVLKDIVLTEKEINIVRTIKAQDKYETHGDADVMILLDCHVDAELAAEGLAREWINRVQRLRKKAGFNPMDSVSVGYKVIQDGGDEEIRKMMVSQKEVLVKALKEVPVEVSDTKGDIVEEVEVGGSRCLMALTKQ